MSARGGGSNLTRFTLAHKRMYNETFREKGTLFLLIEENAFPVLNARCKYIVMNDELSNLLVKWKANIAI